MSTSCHPVVVALALGLTSAAVVPAAEVICEGTYRHHLQGVAADAEGRLYWSFTTTLVKTDAAGRVLARVEVANHHGDLTCMGDRVLVAVNLGRFNQPVGQADSWIYVYAADDLRLLSRHAVPEVVHGAGGIAPKGDGFLVIGGLPVGVEENYVYEVDAEFRFVRRYVIPSGYTRLGIQTACRIEGGWLFGCYGTTLLEVDDDLRLVASYDVDGAYGIVVAADGAFLMARHIPPEAYRAKLVPVPRAAFSRPQP